MNEYEIAKEKVLPYLQEHLKWPGELISAYGRVPVQIGSQTVWGDFVCYISKAQKAVPWLLVEVKKSGIPLEQAIPQAESYSLILDAPFFCVTDGSQFDFYMTGESQGKSIKLQGSPPIPSPEYLSRIEISFPARLDEIIELFVEGLKKDSKFFEDTKKHDEDSKQLHEKVFKRVDDLSQQELKAVFEHIMMKAPNKNSVFELIDEDFDRFKKVLRFIRDFTGDPVRSINKLLDKSGDLNLKGGGIFFVSQLLAGAHPDEYVVLEENISRALMHLSVVDILVKNDTANGYVYVNEICKKLYEDKLEQRLKAEGYSFGLAAVHNLLWHYYAVYRTEKKWWRDDKKVKNLSQNQTDIL